jgi:hypothetical protein
MLDPIEPIGARIPDVDRVLPAPALRPVRRDRSRDPDAREQPGREQHRRLPADRDDRDDLDGGGTHIDVTA